MREPILLQEMMWRFAYIFLLTASFPLVDSHPGLAIDLMSQPEWDQCKLETHFRCPSNGRCIPIEWLCDFTHQCPFGEDESGCVGQICHFDTDLCNWSNEFELIMVNHTVQNHWRQIHPASLRVNQSRSSMMRSLNSSLISVPLSTDETEGNISTALRSTHIGQTGSMCQIRFRYLGWSNEGGKHNVRVRFNVVLRDPIKESIIWERLIEPPELRFRGANWSVGVIELGHKRNFTIEFRATLHEARSRDLNRPHITASMAIQWIEFHECNWPLGPFSASDNLDASDPEYQNSLDYDAINLPFNCTSDKFICPNGICLDRRKMCNWVDDCCDQDVSGCSKGTDESISTCQSVPGMENFENIEFDQRSSSIPSDITNKYAHEDINSSPDFFWIRGSYWPDKLVGIREGPTTNADHFPRLDHTRQTNHGQYLSLELPLEGDLKRKSETSELESAVYWLYLDSPWLVKRGGTNQCRVKLFYNLVSNEPEDGTSIHQVFMTVEHFVLKPRSNSTPIRVIDGIFYVDDSNKLVRERLDGTKTQTRIEYPGIDFWREVNLELIDLNEGEPFFIRILVVFDGDSEGKSHVRSRASFSLDDISSDSGCNLDSDVDQESSKIREKFKRNLTSSSELLGLVRPHDSNGQTVDEEDRGNVHKVISCVFGALFALLGFILLIVFILVPYVERFVTSQHEQIVNDLRDMENFANACELASELEWSETNWRQSAPSEIHLTNSIGSVTSNLATYNSDSFRGRSIEAELLSDVNIVDSLIEWPDTRAGDADLFQVVNLNTRRASIM